MMSHLIVNENDTIDGSKKTPDDRHNHPMNRSRSRQLSEILLGHAAFHYLYAGCELGLFELLWKHSSLSKSQIALHLKLEPYPAKCLLLGLTALNLVLKDGDSYHNGELIEDFFRANIWRDFCNIVRFQAKIVYVGLVDFLDSLRSNNNLGIQRFGTSDRNFYSQLAEDPELKEVFYEFMSSWSKISNHLLIQSINFSEFSNVLDVGGGDATNAIALAQAYPNLSITLLEVPPVCEIARQRITQSSLMGQIHVRGLDVLEHDLPKGHDCILFIHTLVIWSVEENIALLRKAYSSLTEGGKVVIFNSMAADDETGPLMSALDTAYFVAIPHSGGMIYSWKDYEHCLMEAGFDDIQRIDCDFWTPHGIIVATK